ncbi:hypothetical protein [Bacillus cereus]|uniref:hypothetical protein n=1 Tax=Bacillus cereus TaxID=1396 RepID=UPI000BFD7905|nr:hypothetical protein [Bacillus cereus]PGV71981.1 hypothetical protein COD84_24225 [Bacillus cereus]
MEASIESVEVKDLINEEKQCGIIMPIGSMDGYSVEHWMEVKSIIIQATEEVEGIKFKTNIVSQSDGEIDIIHKRIIQNLYNSDIVICDMSGKNPNVMFELGMRLTFDKPTIIIKDDVTDFIFDTGAIEHLIYPKDLRFQKIIEFKRKLASRIKITYEKSQSDPNYSTFLGNFGEFKIAKIDQTAVSDVDQLVLEELHILRREINSVKREVIDEANKSVNNKRNIKRNTSIDNYVVGVIDSFIHGNNDSRQPLEILADDDFIEYSRINDVDIYSMPVNNVLKIISNAQKDIK